MEGRRFNRKPWVPPPAPSLPIAVFRCRVCRAALTGPLRRIADVASLGRKAARSLIPEGHYWPVADGEDFAGQFAVPLDDPIGAGYHADTRRLIGCCGPSGTQGPNRVCACGREVGTERSDCLWPTAIYLDPARVLTTAPDD